MQVHHRQIYSMGTRLDLIIAGVEPELCDRVAGEIGAVCERIEALISIHRHDSPLSLLNSSAHAGAMEVDSELEGIFREIKALHLETLGYFDVTMKPVADFYRDNEGQVIPLTPEIRKSTGMELVDLEPGGIRFTRKGVFMDLGGYGKGYAMKMILPLLDEYGLAHTLISFGESLIYGRGTHPYGESWRVAVPVEDGSEPLQFDLKDEVLSTSGNSLNNQKKFANSGHIVNPVTLLPVTQQGLVSVKSNDPVRAEVYSTALFSAGPERSQEILRLTTDLECRWIIPYEE